MILLNVLLWSEVLSGEAEGKGCWLGNDSHCQLCDVNNRACIHCINSYEEKGICKPIAVKIPNCISYSDQKTCRDCDWNYHVVLGKCVHDPSTCGAAASGLMCIACADPSKAPDDSGSCSLGERCKFSNCLLCSWESCIRCPPGYTIYKGDCVSQSAFPGITGCYQAENTRRCSHCEIGYYINLGTCVASPDAQYIRVFDLEAGVAGLATLTAFAISALL